MLRSLRVANHRSLRDEQELLLMPQYGGERAVVSAVAIYGANASGKSNLLDALQFMQAAVRDSYQRWSPTGKIPRRPFRLDELFRNSVTNTGNGQLVFTTHDATLLGTSLGEPVLARDAVWFVSKDAAGASSVFPLSDFKPRKGENMERRYLGGSYGAVPAVFSDTLVEELLKSREHTDAAS